jgi:hypothetical protein
MEVDSKALQARDAETKEAEPEPVTQSVYEIELTKIDEEYNRNPSPKLLKQRFDLLVKLMRK